MVDYSGDQPFSVSAGVPYFDSDGNVAFSNTTHACVISGAPGAYSTPGEDTLLLEGWGLMMAYTLALWSNAIGGAPIIGSASPEIVSSAGSIGWS